jgi:glyoxylase-like metal-dependent hydrolase (beta-lactamase superfamily II)
MRVIPLKNNPRTYSCKAYLILGDWNRLEDVNTLVDVGGDGFIIDEIDRISTGLGKKPIDQVILTHGHFDHVRGLPEILRKYNPRVYAFGTNGGANERLEDGQLIRMGDRDFYIVHTPAHSNDSICLYCAEEKVIFSGDTPLKILTPEGTYEPAFMSFLEWLASTELEAIYSGHDAPVLSNGGRIIRRTLANMKAAMRN